ncbi:MAG: DNA methylase [Chloroflexi bacterium]|nr:DNA methylase [Chloroflexota bacterium]
MLKDPEFRKIEGFPIGEDEAILALSDPPYYTACPNPFLNEIVEKWRSERAALRDELGLPSDEPAGSKYIVRENMPTKNYHREPFAADVSEGKNDPIYNAHSYHTKVPHKAIMRYILHYTGPGDVVMDGFCGTGMMGIAAQLCGDKKTVESLGYIVKDGIVYDQNSKPISRIGTRKATLIDLSPAATFIAYNYNAPVESRAFEREAKHIIKKTTDEHGWMYETNHEDQKTIGKINFTIWSDVFICPTCGHEMVFWDVAVNKETGEVLDVWNCTGCSSLLSKRRGKNIGAQIVERAQETYFDRVIGKPAKRAKQVPVLLNYSVGNTRFERKPDQNDIISIQKINELDCPYWCPVTRIDRDIDLWYERDYRTLGIYTIDAFYTKRNLWLLASLWGKCADIADRRLANFLRFTLTGMQVNLSRMNRWRANVSFPYNPLSGTLYVAGLQSEANVFTGIANKAKRLVKIVAPLKLSQNNTVITTRSLSSNTAILSKNSIDYIFTDPPFGSNIIYSDLSMIWESWLNLSTNAAKEAVIHRRKKKDATTLDGYRNIMANGFVEMFQALKPGRWMTVEFHNSQNSVWNAIQEAIMQAGFVVADVRTLDKQQGTFKQVTTSTAVKQDLIISAYKPTDEFEKRFISEAGTEQGAWDFMRQHLEQLPLPNIKDGALETLQERLPYLLYDRMVAFHIQRGLTVPLSSPEFYQGLSQRFLEREGMVFTAAQAAAYDKLRLQAERVEQLALFVTDESSARQWLRQELEHEPKTYGDLQPKFVQQLHQSKYEDLPELKVILEQAFLQDEKGHWYVPDPERAADLEKLRQNALLREFNEYRKGKGRLKVFRSEAVRAGFSNAWREREYDVIVEIAERMPESVLQEDQQLLMYYHNAGLRQSSEPRQEKLL